MTHQTFRLIKISNLRARFQYPDFCAEIYVQDVGGLAGLSEHLGGDNGADPQVYLLKILPGNGCHKSPHTITPLEDRSLPIGAITRNAPQTDFVKGGKRN